MSPLNFGNLNSGNFAHLGCFVDGQSQLEVLSPDDGEAFPPPTGNVSWTGGAFSD